MSKKLLLRRPRCNLKHEEIDYTSPSKTPETQLRSTSFKDEIQSEIELLDQEYVANKIDNEKDKTETELNTIVFKNDLNEKSVYNNRCPVVSAWSIGDGLLPSRDVCEGNVSDKTARAFDLANNYSLNTTQSEVYCHNLYRQTEPSIPLQTKATPKHIIIIQIAALLKRQLSDDMDKNIDYTIKKLPKKLTNNYQQSPKFEIILYEDHKIEDRKNIKASEISDILQRNIMKTDKNGYFHHPNEECDNDVSATDVSMVECYMTGKNILNLSAHSINELPHLETIFPNLTVIDISYNIFKNIPEVIFELPFLEELNMKNNPIKILHEKISTMNYLRILNCSFTRISNIPISLFMCPNLQWLDLSYNSIECIPNITIPQKLKSLNLSGNPIRYFKKSFGYLSLDRLILENTLIKPVFWFNGQFEPNVTDKSWKSCDLCEQHLSDFSISTISFCRKFEHVLPILLSFCSSLCRDSFHS